jgi:HSP20 family molecular chaperone IbpA
LILKVEARENTEKEADEVLLSEFSRARILRRFELVNAIDVDNVQARFRDGILDVAAPKLGLKTRRDEVTPSLPKRVAAPKKRRAAKGRGQ